jgi:hypothetical protein
MKGRAREGRKAAVKKEKKRRIRTLKRKETKTKRE